MQYYEIIYSTTLERLAVWDCEVNPRTGQVDYFLPRSYRADYALGNKLSHYPMPAIPLQVKYDFVGCVNIDDVTDPDDPIIVYMWDSWDESQLLIGGTRHA